MLYLGGDDYHPLQHTSYEYKNRQYIIYSTFPLGRKPFIHGLPVCGIPEKRLCVLFDELLYSSGLTIEFGVGRLSK